MDIFTKGLETFGNNNNEDLTIYSEIDEQLKNRQCYLGIDEAGRGPVLGPMVYSIFACVGDNEVIEEKLKKGQTMKTIQENPPVLIDKFSKLTDSKQITEKIREELLTQLVDLKYIAYGIKFIPPAQIAQKSFRRQKYSLNEISHDAAMELIQGLLDRGVKIAKVFVDTVGPMDKYQKKLEAKFPELQFKVDKKADAKYKSVSAASICAKVARDRALKSWIYHSGDVIKNQNLAGSGYTSDSVTTKFLKKNIDPIFGFPNIVRDSWSTASLLLEKFAVKVKWEDLTSDGEDKKTQKISKYFGKRKAEDDEIIAPAKKGQFFSYRELEQTDIF